MFDWDALPSDLRLGVLTRLGAEDRLSAWMAAHEDWAPLVVQSDYSASPSRLGRLWQGREGDALFEARLGAALTAKGLDASVLLTRTAARIGHVRHAGFRAPAAAADDAALLEAVSGNQVSAIRALLARGAPVDARRAALAATATDAGAALAYLRTCNVRFPRDDADLRLGLARHGAIECFDVLCAEPHPCDHGVWLAMLKEAGRATHHGTLVALLRRRPSAPGILCNMDAADFRQLLDECMAGSCGQAVFYCVKALLYYCEVETLVTVGEMAWTACCSAATRGRHDVLAALLGEYDEEDVEGDEMLPRLACLAAGEGRVATVAWLVARAGAPAAFTSAYYRAAAFAQWPAVEALLSAGVPVHSPAQLPHISAACGAAEAGCLDWLLRFVAAGAPLTPHVVRAAARNDHVHILEYLAQRFDAGGPETEGALLWVHVVREAVLPGDAACVFAWLLDTGRWTPSATFIKDGLRAGARRTLLRAFAYPLAGHWCEGALSDALAAGCGLSQQVVEAISRAAQIS
jgi:hypothetical protein